MAVKTKNPRIHGVSQKEPLLVVLLLPRREGMVRGAIFVMQGLILKRGEKRTRSCELVRGKEDLAGPRSKTAFDVSVRFVVVFENVIFSFFSVGSRVCSHGLHFFRSFFFC